MSNPASGNARWYKSPIQESYDEGIMRGFDKCKTKVINIITKNTKNNYTQSDIMTMIEEINKL